MKRLEFTLRAFALTARQLPNAYLAIAGEDYGEEGRLRSLVGDLGIASRTFFLGALARDQVGSLYSGADLLVLLSHRENFGMVVLEAMASGVAVLVGDQVGAAEFVLSSGAGRVVGSDLVETSEAWRSMLMDPALGSYGIRGREYAIARLSSEAVAGEVVDLLCRVTQEGLNGPAWGPM
jgi:glycosyltransferase involved in cell wall biosynthesis